ncbi:MAG: hypothetical protein IBJ16_09380 [Chitinophagaceae bacterium]|nr:hypothetical protein [Chitinophagaceae bacterium]
MGYKIRAMSQNWPARKLVEIEIDEVSFYLDLRLWECRSVHDFSKKFSLDQVVMTQDKMILCWDPRTNNVFKGDHHDYSLRKDELLWYQLPSIEKLDPVGYSALMGYPPLMTATDMKKEAMRQASNQQVNRKAIKIPDTRSRKRKGKHL